MAPPAFVQPPPIVAAGTPLPGTAVHTFGTELPQVTARPSPPIGTRRQSAPFRTPTPLPTGSVPPEAVAMPEVRPPYVPFDPPLATPVHIDAAVEPTAIVAPLPMPDVERSFREGSEVRHRAPAAAARQGRRRWVIGGTAIAAIAIGAVVIVARPWADEVATDDPPATEPAPATPARAPEVAPAPAPAPARADTAAKSAVTAPATDEVKAPTDEPGDRPTKKRHRVRSASKSSSAKPPAIKKPPPKVTRDRKPPKRPPPADDASSPGSDLPF